MRLAARGAYGPIRPGSPLEQLALLGLDEEQGEKIAQSTFLGQAAIGAKEEDVQRSYKNFIHLAAPHLHEDVEKRDARMKSILEEEVKRGSFGIESLQPDDRHLAMRQKPRTSKRRGINAARKSK